MLHVLTGVHTERDAAAQETPEDGEAGADGPGEQSGVVLRGGDDRLVAVRTNRLTRDVPQSRGHHHMGHCSSGDTLSCRIDTCLVAGVWRSSGRRVHPPLRHRSSVADWRTRVGRGSVLTLVAFLHLQTLSIHRSRECVFLLVLNEHQDFQELN